MAEIPCSVMFDNEAVDCFRLPALGGSFGCVTKSGDRLFSFNISRSPT